MRFVSLFSGIEAASVAWGPLGWEAMAFAEIEPFPCAVLEQRFPDVPNLGDVTGIDWEEFKREHGEPDLVCGGSPCQSFSIAGGREGLDGESRLMFEYIRAVRDLRPRWLLWENVPGVFSIDGGRAFGILIDSLEELGYGLAWRTLDAQFFGLAQRRKRVFVVGHIGDVGRAAAVLFEPESVRGNTLTSREKRAALAADAQGRAGGFKFHQGAGAGGVGYRRELSQSLTADWHNPAVCIQGDGSTSLNSHGVGTTRNARTRSTTSTDTPSRSAKSMAACDWRAFDSAVPTLSANPSGTGEGLSLLCLGTGQANAEMCEDHAPTLNADHEQPIVCMADDNANAAIDYGVAGSLKVGGGSPMIASARSARGTSKASARST